MMLARVAKNSLFSMLSLGFQILSIGLLTVGVARYLTVEEFGEFNYVTVLVTSVMTIAYLGIQPILVREISIDRSGAGRYLGQAVMARLVLMTIGVLIILGAALLTPHPRHVWIALGIAIGAELLTGITTLGKAALQALERMELEALATLAFGCALLVAIGSTIYLDLGFVAVFISMVVANLVQFLVLWSLLGRQVRPVFQLKGAGGFFLAESLWLGMAVLLRLNLPKVGVFFLKGITDDSQIAYYRAAQGLYLILETLPAALTIALFPLLSQLVQSDRERMRLLFGKAFTLMLVIGCGLAVLFLTIPDEVITLVYGARYLEAGVPLMAMAIMLVSLFVNPLLSTMLVALRQQRLLVLTSGVAMLVCLVLLAVLVPPYGALGAALATAAGYLFYTMMAMAMLARLQVGIGWRELLRLLEKPVALAVAIYILMLLGKSTFAGSGWWVVGAGAVGYAGLLVVTGIFTREELSMIKGLVRRKPPGVGPRGGGGA